jgi:two-component system, OmpR family, aerobic respiration control sensor histidine kinase ArcB
VFGFLFPLGALTFDCMRQGLPLTWASVVTVHHTNPVHWIVDTAPFFLGMCALVVATRFKRLHLSRQQVEEALRQSDARFHRMASNLPGV